MRYEVIVCDYCNRGNDDDVDATPFLVKPKMGQEGYLIDQETIDMCPDCLKKYKENNPNKDIFYEMSGKQA